jgi:hypothetical protein
LENEAMQREVVHCFAVCAAVGLLLGSGYGQEKQATKTVSVQTSTASSDFSELLPPREHPPTVDQIREFLRLSDTLDAVRQSWIAAVDKNRSIGEPYWPDSFYAAVKEEMQKQDLVPMYVAYFQHSVSMELMQEVLDAYRRLGAEHFKGSPECFKLGDATLATKGELDRVTLAQTQAIMERVYAPFKPQIKAARARYMVEHPDWKDK